MAFDWRLLHISEQVCFDLILFSEALFEDVSSLICTQVNCVKYLTMDPLEVEKIHVQSRLYLTSVCRQLFPYKMSLDYWKQGIVSCLK